MPNSKSRNVTKKTDNNLRINQAIRICLKKFCPDDSEFNKFMMDNFEPTSKKTSSGMDRVAKENLLLNHHSASDILDAIKHDYPQAESYLAELWQEEPSPSSKIFVDENRTVWFSQDLGLLKGFIFRNGPIVLTYLAPSARVSVAVGPPWEPLEEIIELRGTQFRGKFFVEETWSISANSQKCLVSGYYPYPGQPLPDGEHKLSHGAIFYRKFGKQSLIVMPISGEIDIETRKRQAFLEVRNLLRYECPDPSWQDDELSSKPAKYLLGYIDIM